MSTPGAMTPIAIMLAALHPQIDLIGIGVGYNLHGLPCTLENTLRVVQILKMNIPVYAGCPQPLVKDLSARDKNSKAGMAQAIDKDGNVVKIHTAYLDLPTAQIKPQPIHACAWYLDILRNTKEKITMISTGGMTNFAMAIRMDPSIIQNIEEIVIMGGGVNVRNITLAAESNFFRDPEAARIVINCGAKIKIVPLDATYSAPFYPDDAKAFHELGTPVGDLAYEMIQSRINAYTAIGYVETPSSPIHDAITVASVIDPSVLSDVRQVSCDIDMGGSIADGMLIVDTRHNAVIDKPTFVAFKADRDKIFQLIYDTLKTFKQ